MLLSVLVLHSVVLPFESVDEILNYYHLNEEDIKEYFPPRMFMSLYNMNLCIKY